MDHAISKVKKVTLNVLRVKGAKGELNRWITDHSYGENLLNCVVRMPMSLKGKEAEEWREKNWGATTVNECSVKPIDSGLIITFVTDKPPLKWLEKLRCCYSNLNFELTFS